MLNQSTLVDQGPIIFGLQIKSLIPPMVGSFFGVIMAFALNYKYQSYNNKKDKIKYITMIKSELELCITTLELDNVQLLPTDRWTSAVNSGALRLFEVDVELESLSINYYNILDYNNRAMKYIGYHWERLNREDGYRLPLGQVKQFLERRERLRNELKKLKDAEWLNLT